MPVAELFHNLRSKFGGRWFHATEVRREFLDPEHAVAPFVTYMVDSARAGEARAGQRLPRLARGRVGIVDRQGLPPGVPNVNAVGKRLNSLNKRVVVCRWGDAEAGSAGGREAREPLSNRPPRRNGLYQRQPGSCSRYCCMAEDAQPNPE